MPLFAWGAIGVAAVAIVAYMMATGRMSRAPQPGPASRNGEPLQDEIALRNEAVDVARQLVDDFPQDANALGLLGTVYNQFGNSAEAEQVWLKCSELEAGRADVYEVLALSFLTRGDYEKVMDLSNRTLAVAPEMPGVNRHLASALLETGRLDDALAAILKELKISPDESEVYVVLGRIQLQRGEYQQAMNAYTRALELRPGDPRCYFGLSTAAARLGQSEKAAEYTARFTELRAAEDEAAQDRRRATDVIAPAGPILAQTLTEAGRIYSSHQELTRAEAAWKRAAQADPSNVPSRGELVNLYRRTKRFSDAAGVCAQLTAIDPNNGTYYGMTGEVLLEQGQTATALGALRKAVELSPSARNYYLLGQASYRNHDRPAALAALRKAVELDPDNEQMRRQYERLQKEP